ncbi:MAG TPA: tyrosine-protein phosphatase [Acidimicrobiales bacterium]
MLEGVRNFRDIGGHRTVDGRRVRTRKVFRAGHLAAATDADLQVLEELGVSLVIDFRGPIDIAAEGEDRLPPRARLVRIPMHDPARGADIRTILFESPPEVLLARFGDGRAAEAMVRGACAFVTDARRVEQYGLMLRTIIDNEDGATVIHCSAGKDRTGWAASLMLLALGVPEQTVIEHYLESNAHQRDRSERLAQLARAGIDPTTLQPFFEVREEYKRAALEALERSWGGIEGYLRDGLCISDEELARFRATMLEPV